jgi:hypothetical protein
MNPPPATPPHRPYSKWTFALPFGHYEAGGDQEPPANEVLIGREGQRAYLIDLLLNMGRRGVYLVTGRRGAGKTSFVRHCIAEYRAEVFGRFVRSGVDRTLFWDKAILVGLGLAAIAGGLFLSQLMDLLLRTTDGRATSHTALLAWFIIGPTALICTYPLLYAKEVLGVVIGALRPESRREDQRSHLGGVATLIALVLVVWYFGPFGSPAVGLARLFAGICLVYLMIHVVSFRRFASSSKPFRVTYRSLIAVACALGYSTLVGRRLAPDTEFSFDVASALIFFGASTCLRCLELRDVVPSPPHMIRTAMREASFWYGLLGLGTFGLGLAILFLRGTDGFSELVVVSFASAMLPIGAWLRHPIKSRTLPAEPRPLYALSLKAVLAVVVGLVLVHPLLARCLAPWPALVTSTGSPLWLVAQMLFPAGGTLSDVGPQYTQSPSFLGLFGGPREELLWVFTLVVVLAVVTFLEYEWIVRPFLHQRIDPSFAPDPPKSWSDRWEHGEAESRRRMHRELAGMTLPWLIYRIWLPVFVLSVNLGFDDLDHRRVVHAMLATLRYAYHRTFLAWNSVLANIARSVGLLLLVVVVSLVGDRLFATHPKDMRGQIHRLKEQAASGYPKPCEAFTGRQVGATMTNLICRVPAGNQLFHLLYFDLLGGGPPRAQAFRQSSPEHLLFVFLPYQDWDLPQDASPPLLARGPYFRFYDLLLLVVFGVAGRWLFHRLPIFPYQEVLNRVDAMLDSLSSRVRTSSRKTHWKVPDWLAGHFGAESVHERQQDPLDPRTLEFAFLSILQDVQAASLRLPGGRGQLVSLPAPEITYVFDELDKLGARLGPHEASGGSKEEAEILDAERRRSLELHRLLAKMKNLLFSAPARFIFVGGRNMHDEWLADQTARHPQLTNIFNAEVYLPSLLTDHKLPPEVKEGRSAPARLHQRIEQFLLHQERRARILYYRWAKNQWLPSMALPLREAAPESFVLQEPVQEKTGDGRDAEIVSFRILESLKIYACHERPDPRFGGVTFSASLLMDFVYFLTYRSMGNPKKLKELLAAFVRPVGRVVHESTLQKAAEFDCRHVLQFGDLERFRIQLLADIYRHLALTAEERLVYRDDKIATSVFYLADFLFKFHRRAFSWSNLERVDELIHIHHAPDLRDVLEEIVARWSERFLHPIRNGMYAFRFRSDIAREVEYLSRQSAYEMAAFNFTLDESQALKALYESWIHQREPKATFELQDLVAGLGELHEFDQEFETARLYYRRAIRLVDGELLQVLGKTTKKSLGVDQEEEAREKGGLLIGEILRASSEGLADVRLYLSWGSARLRLMLQIGLTFEHVGNLERAALEYRDARTVARSLILASLGAGGPWGEPGQASEDLGERRLHVLKNLNLAFQPTFAEAWVAEKYPGGVDTSVSLVERELRSYRRMFPFVRDRFVMLSQDAANVRSSNFALIMAELHNKIGDLYFFKGRQPIAPMEMVKMLGTVNGLCKRPEGYLLRAHYHYAMGLHELARFVTHRRRSSRLKFNIWADSVGHWDTIAPRAWPDFVARAIGGTINDLAESMLGRVSFFGLFGQLHNSEFPTATDAVVVPDGPEQVHMHLVGCFDAWLESRRTEPPHEEQAVGGLANGEICFPMASGLLHAGTLESWLGVWRGVEPDDNLLLEFASPESHGDAQRLLNALHFGLAGARYLELGGYLEDAGTELVAVAEAVAEYLRWGLHGRALSAAGYLNCLTADKLPLKPSDVFSEVALHNAYWRYGLRLACFALCKADGLFRRSRRAELATENLIGDKIPSSLLTLACSLMLVALEVHESKADERSPLADHQRVVGMVISELEGLIRNWTREQFDGSDQRIWIEELLEKMLVRYGYPMMNRLQTLRTLIDSGVRQLSKAQTSEKRQAVLSQALELLDLAEQFDSPQHFTPMYSGVSCAMVYLFCRQRRSEKKSEKELEEEGSISNPVVTASEAKGDIERLRQAALRDLTTSEEMHTMRRAYYEAISDLYYLYDDFNDRQLHAHAAIEMAGGEVVALLKELLQQPEAAVGTQEAAPHDPLRSASASLNTAPLPAAL